MVESRSMVNGSSPGPPPAAQARDSSSRLTRSSWRTWPHRKLRRKVPRVDGALTVPPRAPTVPPVRNTSAASVPFACGVYETGSDGDEQTESGQGTWRELI